MIALPGRVGSVSPHGRLADAFQREAGGVLGYFVKRGVPAHDAADLVSETFLAAWRSERTADVEPELLRAWLFGIARRTLLRHRRGHVRRSALGDRLRSTLEDESARPSDDTGLAEHVRTLIEALPAIDQEIVRLVYWEGFTQEEVASIIGRPATAVRARLSRARRVLRDRLTEGDATD